MAWYRTYDRQWNRTGYSRDRQYPGQMSMTHDFAEPVVEVRGGGRAGVTKDGRAIQPTLIADEQRFD